MPKNGFFDCFFEKLPAAQQNFAKIRVKQCFGRARKIYLFDLKKKVVKILEIFLKIYPPPPPPPSRKAFIHDYLFLHHDLSVAYYYVLSVLTISRGGFREGCEGGWADALFFQGFDPLTKHWVHICTIFLRFFCTENFLRVPLAPIFTIFEWETHAKKNANLCTKIS